MIAFRKDFIEKIENLPLSIVEKNEFIEQMRIIESNVDLYSIKLPESLPSINEPEEVGIVIDYLKNKKNQKIILKQII